MEWRAYLKLTTWANLGSLPLRKSHLLLRKSDFLLLAFYEGLGNMCTFPGPKQFQGVFLQIFIQNELYMGILLVPLGILLV
jgi:hypothetical protein